jgi:hypothetical protein
LENKNNFLQLAKAELRRIKNSKAYLLPSALADWKRKTIFGFSHITSNT